MTRRDLGDNVILTENQAAKTKLKNEEKLKEAKERKNPLCYFTAISCKPPLIDMRSGERAKRRRRRHSNRVIFD
jgi:hypothetical protein